MRSSRTRVLAAALATIAGGAVAAGPVDVATAAAHHTPDRTHSASATGHGHGFFVVDHTSASQKVEDYGTASALVRDASGREHLVTTQPSAADPSQGRIAYLTRQSDDSPWRAHVVPGLRNLSGGVQVEAHLFDGGQRVFAVFYECDGIFVADAATSASRLPVPTMVTAQDNCADPEDTSSEAPIARAGSVIGTGINVLVPTQIAGNTVWQLYKGAPNGPFTPDANPLPTADGFTPVQVAADPTYGQFAVVGTGTSDGVEGIYEVTQQRYADTWSSPVQVATLNSATDDYTIDSVQTYAHHTFIGLEKPEALVTKHRLYLAKVQPTGQASGAIALPHTGPNDRDLRLVVNTETDNLHAVWTRVITASPTKKSGLMHEAQTDTGWLKPYFLTHWIGDVATEITLTAKRKPVVGYDQ